MFLSVVFPCIPLTLHVLTLILLSRPTQLRSPFDNPPVRRKSSLFYAYTTFVCITTSLLLLLALCSRVSYVLNLASNQLHLHQFLNLLLPLTDGDSIFLSTMYFLHFASLTQFNYSQTISIYRVKNAYSVCHNHAR